MSALALYRQLEERLNGLIGPVKFSAPINLRLERITRLLALLDNPHTRYPIIHVGGTSGKGSTCAMIAAILTAAGYRTGLHTSPHLQILNERYQIDGRPAPTSQLWPLLEEMWPALEQVGREMPQFGRPSYFEAQVALGFMWLAQQGVDVAIIEVGLGGRLDATNVVPARVAVLTNVGLDHTAILGDTVEQIAADKAGIFKPGQIVVSGATQPSVRAIVAARCREVGAALRWVEPPFSAEPVLLGLFQQQNAAVAIAAARAFDLRLSDAAVAQGLQRAWLPGRLEKMQERPIVILDGAHNPDKMAAAAQAMAALYPEQRRVVVLGLKSDKAVRDVLPLALPGAAALVATQFEVKGLWTPIPAAELAAQAQALFPDLPILIETDARQATRRAIALAGLDAVVWVTGSLYLVGDVREEWVSAESLIQSAETFGAQSQ